MNAASLRAMSFEFLTKSDAPFSKGLFALGTYVSKVPGSSPPLSPTDQNQRSKEQVTAPFIHNDLRSTAASLLILRVYHSR